MKTKNILSGIGLHLLIFSICYGVVLLIVASIQHSWISFFEYGWVWNSDTMPPLVWWSIVGRILPTSLLISIIVSPIIYIIIAYLLTMK